MTEKRFYYNTFYYPSDMDRVMEYEIIDSESYPNYPNHDEKEDIPNWFIYIGENDSGWQDMIVDLLNEQDQQIKELEKKITKIEEIIDNRLDNKIIPKWDNNNELFIEEKVGYRYALRQLKKKLIREKICFKDMNIEDME